MGRERSEETKSGSLWSRGRKGDMLLQRCGLITIIPLTPRVNNGNRDNAGHTFPVYTENRHKHIKEGIRRTHRDVLQAGSPVVFRIKLERERWAHCREMDSEEARSSYKEASEGYAAAR